MAKAPTTAAEFDGAGEVWFKVKDIGPTFTSSGAQWDLERMHFIISFSFYYHRTTSLRPYLFTNQG